MLINNNKKYFISNFIKVIELSTKNDCLHKRLIFTTNSINTYYTWSPDLLNLNLVTKNILHYNNKLNSTTTYNSIISFYYPIISKFKLLGRHYKLKKKKSLIVCSLNYSHRLYFLNNTNLTSLKLKTKLGRFLFISWVGFNNNLNSIYLFRYLRNLNYYTFKGIKNTKSYKFKRKGKVLAN